MAARNRDYAREYQRRNDLAKQRGFRNYGQQRRYTEYTGTPARYVTAPVVMHYIPLYNVDDYSSGDDTNLDIFMRMAHYRGMEEGEAYDRYMRRSRGGTLSRGALKRLEIDTFDINDDETWY